MTRAQKNDPPVVRCPYGDCPFQGTEAQVDDHVVYVGTFNDKDHEPHKLRDSH